MDLDKRLNPLTREAFLVAMDAWERATLYRECFALTQGVGIQVRALDYRAQFTEYGYAKPCEDGWCIQACWSERKGHIAVLDDFQFDNSTTFPRRTALAAHELGHMLGLNHNMDLTQPSVMHPDYSDCEPVSPTRNIPTVDVMAYEANR
jgi:hypothetical protein